MNVVLSDWHPVVVRLARRVATRNREEWEPLLTPQRSARVRVVSPSVNDMVIQGQPSEIKLEIPNDCNEDELWVETLFESGEVIMRSRVLWVARPGDVINVKYGGS